MHLCCDRVTLFYLYGTQVHDVMVEYKSILAHGARSQGMSKEEKLAMAAEAMGKIKVGHPCCKCCSYRAYCPSTGARGRSTGEEAHQAGQRSQSADVCPKANTRRARANERAKEN